MLSWAQRRKLIIFLIIAIPLTGAFAFFIYPILYPTPTCFDKTQNGDEKGVDCGGSCAYLCPFETAPLTVQFGRSLMVLPGVYTAIGYIQNPNPNAYSRRVEYTFTLFDKDNVFVADRKGSAIVLPGGVTPVIEIDIRTGERIPVRTLFEITTEPKMQTLAAGTVPSLSVSSRKLTGEGSSPRLEAMVKNDTLEAVSKVEVVAVVFDTDGNARAASKTTIQTLRPGEGSAVVFTWPEPFTFTPGKLDVLPRATTSL